jgi:hypothetical protein
MRVSVSHAGWLAGAGVHAGAVSPDASFGDDEDDDDEHAMVPNEPIAREHVKRSEVRRGARCTRKR